MAQDGSLDTGYVILGGGMGLIAVEQNGKEPVEQPDGTITLVAWEQPAIVQCSRQNYFDPRIHEAQIAALMRTLERRHMRSQADAGKWCSACGDTRPQAYFSPEPRNRDGLRAHCKQCRNVQNRKLYAREREALGQSVREYKRREAAVIEVDFAPSMTPLKRSA